MDFFILTKQQLQEEIQNGLKLQLEEFVIFPKNRTV